jgi:hypothetical protein
MRDRCNFVFADLGMGGYQFRYYLPDDQLSLVTDRMGPFDAVREGVLGSDCPVVLWVMYVPPREHAAILKRFGLDSRDLDVTYFMQATVYGGRETRVVTHTAGAGKVAVP